MDPTGAGDSFAGAMIGYLASKKKTSLSEIKRSVMYGNVMGSFAVERYGVDALRGGLADMSKRNVYEPLKVKEQVIKAAVEVTNMILRIDDTISSAKGGGAGGPPGGMDY